eukprot:Skav211558  [mRNA]  locus=scaffold2228:116375:121024:+ [translate_table: standard]
MKAASTLPKSSSDQNVAEAFGDHFDGDDSGGTSKKVSFAKVASATASARVPGTSATTVSVKALWNSMTRWILQSPCGRLRTFFLSSFKSKANKLQRPVTDGSVWPLPLPHPQVGLGGEDHTVDIAMQHCLNNMVVVLNWLHLGQPGAPPRTYCAALPLNGRQRAVVGRLRRFCDVWQKVGEVTAEDMGRSASKMETLEEAVAKLEKTAVTFAETSGYGIPNSRSGRFAASLFSDVQQAKPVVASRLNFGGTPQFDPREHLDATARAVYEDPASTLLPEEHRVDPPVVRVHGRRWEVLQLLRKLDATGRLAIFPEHYTEERYRAGLFCLPKNSTTDRLILDSLPSNSRETCLNRWTQSMASPMPLLSWTLREGEEIRTAGEDLRDYYYYFAVGPSRSRRNTLRFKLSRREAESFKAFAGLESSSSSHFCPALCTLAMGDGNAVEIGQQCHVKMALDEGVINPEDLVTLRGRAPRGKVCAGVVIDDLVTLQKMTVDEDQPIIADALADLMVEIYQRKGLNPHDKTRFRSEKLGKFWGCYLDGEAGLIGPQVERVLPLAMITAQVARCGSASRKLLEVIAGAWTSVLQYRKRCMCLLDQVFQTIMHNDYGTAFQMSADCVAELWTLVALGPSFCTDLRVTDLAEITCVDASSDWKAEVASPLPEKLAEELHRHGLSKSSWTRMLSPLKALKRSQGTLEPEDELPDPEDVFHAHPLWTDVIRSQTFHERRRARVRAGNHINISELEAALDAEQTLALNYANKRFLLASDSQVVLGALLKGRSASRCLNRRLQRHLPFILGQNCYTTFQYVNTLDNPADDPTRCRTVRGPAIDEPEWLETAAAGEFAKLDELLQQTGLDDIAIARLPAEMREARRVPDVRGPTDRQVRRRAFAKQRSSRSAPAASPPSSTSLKVPPTSCRTSRISRTPGAPDKPPVAASSPVPVQPWLRRAVLSAPAERLIGVLPSSQFVLPPGKTLEELRHYKGHLDLFSGSRGAAKALAKKTGCWVLTYDILHSASEDLLDPSVRQAIERMISEGCFWSVAAGPVCASFSRAVRPPVRSRAFPRGLSGISDNMQIKVEVGNDMSFWVAALVRLAHQHGLLFWVENPWLSFLWQQPEWLQLVGDGLGAFYTTDYCRWGTPWRKRTSFFTNTSLGGQKVFCVCSKPHVRLVGYCKSKQLMWTKIAEPYPVKLCRLLAAAIAEGMKPAERREKLDAAACARCSARVGEASNPGPRPRFRGDRPLDLEQVQRVEQTTLALQARVHGRYLAWLQQELEPAAFQELRLHPELQVLFLRSFGNWLYQHGEPLYIFRHLVVFIQQQFPTMRDHVTKAWDLLQRWELVEPVSHRPPLPKSVLDSMVSLALSWRWVRWAAVTMLAFHGCLRAGEPLKATRKDLLLPSDAELPEGICYLLIASPKTRRRGRGAVQHAKVTHPETVRLCSSAFKQVPPDGLLYPASPATYRLRWNRLLSTLGIPTNLALTPGSLRAGGAVHQYHIGVGVTDLCWKMRIKHLATLESYLQETAAVNIILELPVQARENVKACAQMLPHQIAALDP